MRLVNGVLFVFCVGAVSLWGQGSTAQISGTIRDATGAGVPSADIRVTQTATGVSRAILSGEDGGYVVPNLPVGPYLVQSPRRASASMFNPVWFCKSVRIPPWTQSCNSVRPAARSQFAPTPR